MVEDELTCFRGASGEFRAKATKHPTEVLVPDNLSALKLVVRSSKFRLGHLDDLA